MTMEWIEWIGYVASAVIAGSLLMTNIKRLRTINSIGCVLFVVYGALVGAYPVVFSNAVIFLINMYQLWKLKQAVKE